MSLRLMSVPVPCRRQRRKGIVTKDAEMFGNISSIDTAIRRRTNVPEGSTVRPYRVAVRYGVDVEGQIHVFDAAVHFEGFSETLWNCFFRSVKESPEIQDIFADRMWLRNRDRLHHAVLEMLKIFFSRLESKAVIERLTRIGPSAIEPIEEGSSHEQNDDVASLLR